MVYSVSWYSSTINFHSTDYSNRSMLVMIEKAFLLANSDFVFLVLLIPLILWFITDIIIRFSVLELPD